MTADPQTADSCECLTCATDTGPDGVVRTRTSVLIETLRRFADYAHDACCANNVAHGLAAQADELQVAVEASRSISAREARGTP